MSAKSTTDNSTPVPCTRCKGNSQSSCTMCKPSPPSPCIMCNAALTYFKLGQMPKPLMHVRTTCNHSICYKCIFAFKACQYDEHERSRKTPSHHCHICGKPQMRISPKGESPEGPYKFLAAQEVDVFGKVGFSNEFPPSLLQATEKLEKLKLTIPEILSAVLFKERGYPAKTVIPISLETFRTISDILDQVDLGFIEDVEEATV